MNYWCPTINMARDPRWGRDEENYGEDPFLAGQLAVQFIKGMQGNESKYLKTVACAKHFAANNYEQGRQGSTSFMTKHILSLSLEGINLMSEMYTAQEITKILPTDTKEKKKIGIGIGRGGGETF